MNALVNPKPRSYTVEIGLLDGSDIVETNPNFDSVPTEGGISVRMSGDREREDAGLAVEPDSVAVGRLASPVRNEARQVLAEHGLQPVQFEALHYLTRCNRYSDTPTAVTEFLGQTKGTVSQTLKVLERKELIRKVPDAEDRRVVHLEVTAKGKKLVSKLFPSPLLDRAISQMPPGSAGDIEAGLVGLLREVQRVHGFRRFGQCRTCVHNREQAGGGYLCDLTGESLSDREVKLICREHLDSE